MILTWIIIFFNSNRRQIARVHNTVPRTNSEKRELKFCNFSKRFLKMILTKCISSLQQKCIKIGRYDVYICLISFLTSSSYNAELVILLPENTRLWMFSPILFTGKCDMFVSKYSGTTLRFFFSFFLRNKTSLKGNVTCLISFSGVDLLKV